MCSVYSSDNTKTLLCRNHHRNGNRVWGPWLNTVLIFPIRNRTSGLSSIPVKTCHLNKNVVHYEAWPSVILKVRNWDYILMTCLPFWIHRGKNSLSGINQFDTLEILPNSNITNHCHNFNYKNYLKHMDMTVMSSNEKSICLLLLTAEIEDKVWMGGREETSRPFLLPPKAE